MTAREQQFMQAAIELARKGMNSGHGGPFGSVIVKGDAIVGRGYNSVLLENDPTAHAEVVAIRDACRHLNTFQLAGCELYTTCEPCPMCLGAIYWARPEKVYFACTHDDAANAGFDDSFIYEELGIPMSDRKIPMITFGREVSMELFEEWIQKPDKRVY